MLREFSVERTAQAAAVLLRASEGQRMPYIRLLKLLYVADRECIQETGLPITGDDPYAMRRGPVLSITYDLLKGNAYSGAAAQGMPLWKQWLRTVADYDVELIADPGFRKLSRYEIAKLKEVATRYADRDHWDIIDELHKTLPEWIETYRNDGSSHPISIEKLLDAVGQSEHASEIVAVAEAHQAFGQASSAGQAE